MVHIILISVLDQESNESYVSMMQKQSIQYRSIVFMKCESSTGRSGHLQWNTEHQTAKYYTTHRLIDLVSTKGDHPPLP